MRTAAACSFQNPCPANGGAIASYRIAESTMTLRDNSAPAATKVAGDLIANPQWRGTMPLSFTATDTGSGVYRVIVDVDGHDALGAVVDANDGHCADADATNTDAHEFLWAAPCRTSVAPQMAIDTGGLPLGIHAVSIALEDAAGNRTPIYRAGGQDDRRAARRPRRAQRQPGQRRRALHRTSPSHRHDLVQGAPAACPRAPRRPGRQAHRRRADRRALATAPRRRALPGRRLDAHEPQGRLQLQGAARRVADAALRLSLARQRHRLHDDARRPAARPGRRDPARQPPLRPARRRA